MKKKLENLIEVRKIIAFCTILLFLILSIKGILDPNFIEYVILTVVTFYFAKSTALDGGEKK